MFKKLKKEIKQEFYFYYLDNLTTEEVFYLFDIIAKFYKAGLVFVWDKNYNRDGAYYKEYNLIVVNLAKLPKYFRLFTTFFHELTHHLQYRVFKDPKKRRSFEV